MRDLGGAMDRHDLDYVSLVFGVLFAAVGVALAGGALRLEEADLGSAISLALVFGGLVVAAFTLDRFQKARSLRSASEEPGADLAGEQRAALGEPDTTIDPL